MDASKGRVPLVQAALTASAGCRRLSAVLEVVNARLVVAAMPTITRRSSAALEVLRWGQCQMPVLRVGRLPCICTNRADSRPVGAAVQAGCRCTQAWATATGRHVAAGSALLVRVGPHLADSAR